MSDEPDRLTDGPSLGGALLRAARSERAPAGAVERALATLAASPPPPAATATTTATTTTAATRALLARIGLATLMLGAGVGLVVTRSRHAPPAPPAPTALEVAAAPASASSTGAAPATDLPATDRDESKPTPPAPPSSAPAPAPRAPPSLAVRAAPSSASADVATGTSSATPPPVSSTELAEEVALLDRARGHLQAGSPSQALSALDAYDRWTGKKQLTRVASELRARALEAQPPPVRPER